MSEDAKQYSHFWNRVAKQPNGCWNWLGKLKSGRGRIIIGKRVLSAHRVAWMLTKGEIPEGYDVRKRDIADCTGYCLNPDHRELVVMPRSVRTGRPSAKCCPLCGK